MIHNMMMQFWKNHGRTSWPFMHNFMYIKPLHHPELLRLRCVLATSPRLQIRSCLLPRRAMAQEPHGVQERGNQTILDRIKMAAPKVKDQRPLDPSRVMEMDDRDPRTEATQWPCFGHHTASKPCSNAHGQWTQCAICNLRLRYVPKVGSNSQSTKVENRFMVLRMLTELQPLMRGAKPTAAICLAMQKKIDAEEALNHAIDKELMNQKVMGYQVGGRPKAKASPTRTTPMVEPVPTTPRSSATQWDVIPAESPQRLANDLFEHLTMEEKDQLEKLMIERRQAASQAAAASVPVLEQGDLSQAFENEMA